MGGGGGGGGEEGEEGGLRGLENLENLWNLSPSKDWKCIRNFEKCHVFVSVSTSGMGIVHS